MAADLGTWEVKSEVEQEHVKWNRLYLVTWVGPYPIFQLWR